MDFQATSEILLKHWMLSICASSLIYFAVSAVYELYFSPLAKYPGPLLARISSLPSFYYSTTGYRHIWIWQCHQKYGSACRVQPNEVIFNTPSAYRSIYNQAANVRKADIYMVWRRNINSISTLTEIEKSAHGKKKRLLTAAFTDKAIRSAETFISQHVDRLCELILSRKEKDSSQNMSQLSNYLVFDIMCDLSFGKSFGIKEPEPNPLKNITKSFDNYTTFMSNIGRSPFLYLWLWLKTKGLNTLLERVKPQDMGILFDLIHESVFQRMKEEMNGEESHGGRKDMFHYLFHNQDSETGERAYSDDVLAVESGLLLSTALGATATTISALFFYITRNPRVYSKLVTEIRSNFSSTEEIQNSSTIQKCRYLRACIEETLRMTPAAPGENMRIVLSGGQEIDGHVIPEGTLVGTSSWSLFHSEEFFGDSWVFRPERWVVDETAGISAASVAEAQNAFYPFGLGPVSCVGQKLARSILLIMVAKTLYQLDVNKSPGSRIGEGDVALGWGRRDKRVFQVRDATFALRDGPSVQFTEAI